MRAAVIDGVVGGVLAALLLERRREWARRFLAGGLQRKIISTQRTQRSHRGHRERSTLCVLYVGIALTLNTTEI
jgi:hypothetical protein